MDFKEKEILTTNRVELVENINILDGLYSQLMARKVLTQRAVNRIKVRFIQIYILFPKPFLSHSV